MGSIPGRRSDGWCCPTLEMHGRMPCHACPRFDRAALECVGGGWRIGNEVLKVLRGRYVPAIEAIEVVEDGHGGR